MANPKSDKKVLVGNDSENVPLYNMSQDRPHVDSTLRNWEKINAPYINNMLMPLQIDNIDDRVEVYDKEGHKFYADEYGNIYRDDAIITTAENRHFEREEIDLSKYLAYDISDYYEAYIEWDDVNNIASVVCNGNTATTDSLFIEGSLITSRIRILGNMVIAVVYFDSQNIERFRYIRMNALDGTVYRNTTYNVQWRSQTMRRTTANNITSGSLSRDVQPVINICNPYSDYYGVSLVNATGFVMNSRNLYADTFVENNNYFFRYGSNFNPNFNSTVLRDLTTTTNAFFNVRTNNVMENESGACLGIQNENGVWDYYYYTESGVVGEKMDIPTSYVPTQTSTRVLINDVEYVVCNYFRVKYINQLRVSSSEVSNFSITATGNNGITYSVSTTNGIAINEYTTYSYSGQNPVVGYKNTTVLWGSQTAEIPISYWNKSSFPMQQTTTTTTATSWATYPNVFLDNGNMYSIWTFTSATTSWNNLNVPNGWVFVESGKITNITTSGVYTVESIESALISSSYTWVPRSNSFCVGQNFFQDTVRLSNTNATVPTTAAQSGETSDSARFMEWTNSNGSDMKFFPGTFNSTSFNYWAHTANTVETDGYEEDLLTFTPMGVRTPVGSSKFNLLYNTESTLTSTLQGISFSESADEMGTLLVPWVSIDEDWYIAANSSSVVYRSTNGKWYKISLKSGIKISAALGGSYIIFNTPSYFNCFDVDNNKLRHYASDYNQRMLLGTKTSNGTISDNFLTINFAGTSKYIRGWQSGINCGYLIRKPFTSIASILRPSYYGYRPYVGDITVYNSRVPESQDIVPIDVYYSEIGSYEILYYKYSLYPFLINSRAIENTLINTSYTIDSILSNMPILMKFIDGQGLHDFVTDDLLTYQISYASYRPMLLYSESSQIDGVTNFLIIQGQTYAIIQDKIYAISYSGGSITEMQAVVDIRGMQFVGNTTMIAFFYSPTLRNFYSWTGDAALQTIYNASKIHSISGEYFYDESTMSIFIPTDIGLLVFGAYNTFMLEDYKDVTNVQFSNDGKTHIQNGEKNITVSYYADSEYNSITMDLETSFFGPGATLNGHIDRFGIVLYDYLGIHPDIDVIVGVRSITDITVKSEEKKIHISKRDWDDWSHSAIINYVPAIQKGRGLRLYIKTPITVQQIVGHLTTSTQSTLSKLNI